MELYYGNYFLGHVLTNHSMSIDDLLEALDIDMDAFAASKGWDDWDYFELWAI